MALPAGDRGLERDQGRLSHQPQERDPACPVVALAPHLVPADELP
jgi:hypothetical protein